MARLQLVRKDVHRPSAINPSEYEFVAFDHIKIESLGECAFVLEQRNRIRQHLDSTGGTYSNHEHGGSCHICGASAQYTALFYHTPTNSYIRTGQDCAQKMEMAYSDDAMSAFRVDVKRGLEAQAGKRKAQAVLEQAGLMACWAIYLGEGDRALFVGGYEHNEENTIRSIVGKLVKYGSISEAQSGFLATLLTRIEQRPAIEEARQLEREAAADCPEGRLTIVGEVCGFKEQDTDFGTVLKVIIKADTGFKIYGTCNFDCKRGDRVSLVATVTRSDSDSKFGFFKRPAKGEVLQATTA